MAGFFGGMGGEPLFVLRGANLQSTADQVFVRVRKGTLYIPRRVAARLRTGGVTVACAGAIYTGAGKTGDQLVAVAQVWTGLTGAGTIVEPVLASIALAASHSQTPILSLTTGSTGAATADFFFFGDFID